MLQRGLLVHLQKGLALLFEGWAVNAGGQQFHVAGGYAQCGKVCCPALYHCCHLLNQRQGTGRCRPYSCTWVRAFSKLDSAPMVPTISAW